MPSLLLKWRRIQDDIFSTEDVSPPRRAAFAHDRSELIMQHINRLPYAYISRELMKLPSGLWYHLNLMSAAPKNSFWHTRLLIDTYIRKNDFHMRQMHYDMIFNAIEYDLLSHADFKEVAADFTKFPLVTPPLYEIVSLYQFVALYTFFDNSQMSCAWYDYCIFLAMRALTFTENTPLWRYGVCLASLCLLMRIFKKILQNCFTINIITSFVKINNSLLSFQNDGKRGDISSTFAEPRTCFSDWATIKTFPRLLVIISFTW